MYNIFFSSAVEFPNLGMHIEQLTQNRSIILVEFTNYPALSQKQKVQHRHLREQIRSHFTKNQFLQYFSMWVKWQNTNSAKNIYFHMRTLISKIKCL